MDQLSPSETNRLRWLFKLERQETMSGISEGWVPIRSDKQVVKRLIDKGLIHLAVITEKGVGYRLTRQGAEKVGD